MTDWTEEVRDRLKGAADWMSSASHNWIDVEWCDDILTALRHIDTLTGYVEGWKARAEKAEALLARVHGALTDAGSVVVPGTLEGDLVPAIQQLVRERDDARRMGEKTCAELVRERDEAKAEAEGWKNQAQEIAKSNADHVRWHREMEAEIKRLEALNDVAERKLGEWRDRGAELERRRALAESTQLECNRLAEDNRWLRDALDWIALYAETYRWGDWQSEILDRARAALRGGE